MHTHTLSCVHANKHINTHTLHFAFGMPPSGPEANWHSLVSTSVTLSAACEVGTEQQSQAFGNICGQLRGEEGAKERNLLLINKIMGAIRPFSHHYCLQSLSHSLPFFPSLCLTHSISLFSVKKCIPFFLRMKWKKECERKKERKFGGKGEPDPRTNN